MPPGPNTDNMSFYHYTNKDSIVKILESGEIWAQDGSFGYGVYALDAVPSKKRAELAGRAFGGHVQDKFGFAVKVRMPKPGKDRRMTKHYTKDDRAIQPNLRDEISKDWLQFKWSEPIKLDQWSAVTAIVRAYDEIDGGSGRGPLHVPFEPRRSAKWWKQQLDIKDVYDAGDFGLSELSLGGHWGYM